MGKIQRLVKAIRRLAGVGRPKTGRIHFSYSVSLTLEQIAFLRKQEESSKFLRKILDEMMSLQQDLEPKLHVVALKHEIDVLQETLGKLKNEKDMYMIEKENGKRRDDEMFVWAGEEEIQKGIKVPVRKRSEATPKARYYWKIVDGMDEGIKAVKKKIAELKAKIMAS